MIEITDYQSLLAAGRQEPNPQRFLFVFLQASLPEEYNETDKDKFHAGQGGELKAIMCVDKDLDELTNFSDLVSESKQMEQDWSMVLIACLAGNNGMHPSAEEAEQPLKMMVQTVQSGGDLSKYLAFDRQGFLLHFS
ncbi:hypothetical protein BJAS_P1740 [Bathymodiolus japonicus methanotrophic gill symbiont]|uniref:ribonucleotide reductase subunit alpha n=1 Tax=Bathymodiolus japonicus methanotrophic gill symbiont TaxID=113269 RepID=UPI001B78FFA4|nr:ribonucleotide reductase subunit alpha [Bathymodiolus japonicus methanotrophic gill symbiont]GFO71911.1 hypothetical protein BJAS_P1740 [Bathymodiolus japonicus methanotrophic gill symbiont]